MPVVIHIGTEKTGSTAIQSCLKNNLSRLCDQHGILVPRCLGQGTAVNLAAACQRGDTPDSLRRMRQLDTTAAVLAYYEALRQELAEEISDKRPDRLLLSCENFSSRLRTRDDIEALREFIAPFASSVSIVVYLRRQADMIVSSHTTKVRNGFTGRFNIPPRGRERPDTHYDQLLALWADVFGEENITVRLYEASRLKDADIVSDFCAATQLPESLERTGEKANRTPDAKTLEIMRLLNTGVPHRINDAPNPLRGDLMDALAARSTTSTALPATGELQARFDTGNRAVAARWFAHDASVPETLFEPLTDGAADESDVRLSVEDALATAAHLWNHAQNELRATRLERDCLRAELHIAKGQFTRAMSLCEAMVRRYPGEQRCVSLLARARENA